ISGRFAGPPGRVVEGPSWGRTSSMILVIGSTGTVGREVVRELKELGADFHALVRDPAKAVALKGQGVEPVIGDLSKIDAVRSALAGRKSLFLLTTAAPDML